MDFNSVADEWLEYQSECVKPITIKRHKELLKRFRSRYGSKDILDITRMDIKQYVANLTKQGLAKSTIKKYKYSVQLVYEYAIDKEYIKYNPCYKVKIPPNAPVSKREALTDKEIEIVKKNVENHDLGFYALFLLYTGCRRSEALAMQWKDIDFENKTISINKILCYEEKTPVIQRRLKNGSTQRKVPILKPLEKELLKRRKNKKDFIFTYQGELFTKSNINSRWKSYQCFIGLNVTQHQFRHTYCTLAYRAGVPVKATQALLGHKSMKMTLDIYTHISERDISTAAKTFNSYFIDK